MGIFQRGAAKTRMEREEALWGGGRRGTKTRIMRATRLRSLPLQVLSVVVLVWAGLCAHVHARDRLFREAYAHANTQQGGKLLCEAMPEIGDYIVGVYRNHPVASVVNSLESLPMNLQQFDSFNLFSATLTRWDPLLLFFFFFFSLFLHSFCFLFWSEAF